MDQDTFDALNAVAERLDTLIKGLPLYDISRGQLEIELRECQRVLLLALQPYLPEVQ